MIVYCLTNTTNGKRYVGQTIHSLDVRVKEHVRVAKRGSKYPIHCAIRKYGIESFNCEILQTCSTHNELNVAEIEWIAKYKQHSYNLSEGGSGVRGKGIWTHSDNAKKKISLCNKGRIRTEFVKKQISEKVRFQFENTNLRQRISDATKLAISNPQTRLKIEKNNYVKRRKKIEQLTLEGSIIAVFDSASIAASVTGINKGNLCACARGCFKQAGGFRWRYVDA